MEIKSKKMPKTEKMQKMCILLGAIIIIIVLVFMPNGFISAINAIKMKQLSVWELMIMSFLSFVPMWIVIEDIVLGMISCQISYRLKENGIEILYKGKVRRAYKWDEMRTHRIVYMGKGTLRNSEDFWCDVKACVVFSTRRIKDSFFQSPFPFEACILNLFFPRRYFLRFIILQFYMPFFHFLQKIFFIHTTIINIILTKAFSII